MRIAHNSRQRSSAIEDMEKKKGDRHKQGSYRSFSKCDVAGHSDAYNSINRTQQKDRGQQP